MFKKLTSLTPVTLLLCSCASVGDVPDDTFFLERSCNDPRERYEVEVLFYDFEEHHVVNLEINGEVIAKGVLPLERFDIAPRTWGTCVQLKKKTLSH